jgi:hypothetical protein
VEDDWFTRPELAGRWKMPKSTLDQWASQRKGPPYAMFGRHARYRLSDIVAWESAQFADRREAVATEKSPEPELEATSD